MQPKSGRRQGAPQAVRVFTQADGPAPAFPKSVSMASGGAMVESVSMFSLEKIPEAG